ncbi:MAG: transcriptional regulator [Desulfurococcaceae archaeon]|jgi:predicted transcriptional regulator
MKTSLKNKVLELLRNHQGSYVPQSFIYRALGASKSRVSEILSELEHEGLISRITVGRTKIVYIYPQLREADFELKQRVLKLGIVFSSEYLFLGDFIKKLREKNINVEVIVYRDGLEATIALAKNAVDLALSPLVGQLYIYPVYRTYKVILAGLKGGFRVLSSKAGDAVYSSIISTMDYVRHYLVSRKLIEASETLYYKDPGQITSLFKRKGGYVVTWHPVYLELEKHGFRELYTPSELEIDFCCTLGISNTVGKRTYKLIKEAYLASIDEYARNPGRNIEYYASLTGIDTSVLKTAVDEYKVSSELGFETIDKLVNAYAFNIPSRSKYIEACDA